MSNQKLRDLCKTLRKTRPAVKPMKPEKPRVVEQKVDEFVELANSMIDKYSKLTYKPPPK